MKLPAALKPVEVYPPSASPVVRSAPTAVLVENAADPPPGTSPAIAKPVSLATLALEPVPIEPPMVAAAEAETAPETANAGAAKDIAAKAAAAKMNIFKVFSP